MPKIKNITVYEGEKFKDLRGGLEFFNTFKFKKIKRFYIVSNSAKNPIRAFHGHLKEEKYVFVISGEVVFCAVKINNKKEPSRSEKVEKFLLSEKKPRIVHVPGGYANGFKSIKKNSKVMFFSTASLAESKRDDFRFPKDYWGKEVWK